MKNIGKEYDDKDSRKGNNFSGLRIKVSSEYVRNIENNQIHGHF